MFSTARALPLFFLALAPLFTPLLSVPAEAAESGSASFRNVRSAVNAGGRRKTSATYREDGTAGDIARSTFTSASHRARSGLQTAYHYPGRVTDLFASSAAASTEVYLQWTTPGNDGFELSTPGAYVVRYSSLAADSPAISDAKFNAASVVTPAPPGVQVKGSRLTMNVTGLAAGVTYYFAIKTAERDGTRSVLSAGATAQTLAPLGCFVTRNVHKVDGPYTTIQSAVDSLPNPLTGHACVIVRDAVSYAEQVTVRNFVNNGSSITITADPALSGRPRLQPPATSTAAFLIAQASVNVYGLDIIPNAAVQYGIHASSAYVRVSSVNVDGAAYLWQAAIQLSSLSVVSNSSVSLSGGARALWVAGSSNTVYMSSFTAFSGPAIKLSSAVANSFDLVFSSGGVGNALNLHNSSLNRFSRSKFQTHPASNFPAIYLWDSSSNSFTLGSSSGMNANALLLNGRTDANVFSSMTFFSSGTAPAVFLTGSRQNLFENVVASAALRNALDLEVNVFGNVFRQSTASAGGLYSALYTWYASSNVFSDMDIRTRDTFAVYLEDGSQGNLFSRARIENEDVVSGDATVFVTAASSNVFADSFVTARGIASAFVLATGADMTQIVRSTVNAGVGYSGIYVWRSSRTYVADSYVEGERALYVDGSTGTVARRNTLYGDWSAGYSVVALAQAGARDLTLAENVIDHGDEGVWVEQTGGAVLIASNTVLGQWDDAVAIATISYAGSVNVDSNTVVMPLVGSDYVIGVAFYGPLASGATAQGNHVVIRARGGSDLQDYAGLFARSVSGVVFRRNRVSNPGMVTDGNFYGLGLRGATGITFEYNDVHSTGTALDVAYLVGLESSTATLRNNVFSSSYTASYSSSSLFADAASGFTSDYNTWFSSNARNTLTWGPAAYVFPWSSALGRDANSLAFNPRWADPRAGAEDFHPKALAGRWNPATSSFVNDAADSRTIDAGDPDDDFSAETSPNGSRVNQGSYGGTAQASRSTPASYPGCATVRDVHQQDGPYTTVGSALASLPASLTGHACVVIKDGAIYAEQVTVQNFTNNGSSISIFADPASGLRPVVDPPSASTAAFVIRNASVNVSGLDIRPGDEAVDATYGVLASSAYVRISSVNMDAGGTPANKVTLAGVRLSSWSALSYSSITVGAAYGLWLEGSTKTVVAYSSAVNSLSTRAALYLQGASSNTFTVFLASNSAGGSLLAESQSNDNVISYSTLTSNAASGSGVYIEKSSRNVLSHVYVRSPRATGVELWQADSHLIEGSTVSVNLSGRYTLLLGGDASSNVVRGSFLSNPLGDGVELFVSYFTLIEGSTITAGGSGFSPALNFINGSSNTLRGSYVAGATYGLFLDQTQHAIIADSTITSSGAGETALWMQGGSTNVVTRSLVSAPAGFAAYLDNPGYSRIDDSVLSAASSWSTLSLDTAYESAVQRSFVANTGTGRAVSLTGADRNLILASTMTSAASHALAVLNSDTNTVQSSYLQGVTAASFTASSWNGISQSTLAANSATGAALYLSVSASNTVTGSFLSNPTGNAALLELGSGYNTLSMSTMVTAGANRSGVVLDASSDNTLSSVYAHSEAGSGGYISNASHRNLIENSTFTTAAASFRALLLDNADDVVIRASRIHNPAGSALEVYGVRDAVSLSSVTGYAHGIRLVAATTVTVTHSYVAGSTAVWVRGSTGTAVLMSVLESTAAGGAALQLWDGSVNLTVSSSEVRGVATSRGIALSTGNAGVVSLGSVTFTSSGRGIELSTQSSAFVLDASSVNFRSLASGATAIHFLGGTFVTTITLAGFEDASIGANVSGAALDAASRVTMRKFAGSRGGSAFENDPNGLVDWVGESLPYPGCAYTANVGAEYAYTSISAGVASVPATLTGHSCVVLRDAATYAEQVTVEGFTNNGSSISIFTDPALGAYAELDPPAGSTAAFVVRNASVNIAGFSVAPKIEPVTYGVYASSALVRVSSVLVDGGALLWGAGVRLGSWSSLDRSTVAVRDAAAVWLEGSSRTLVNASSMTSAGAARPALLLWGASSNTVSGSFVENAVGTATALGGGWGNRLEYSTFTAVGGWALYGEGSSSNSLRGLVVRATSASGAYFDAGSHLMTVTDSVFLSSGPAATAAFELYGSSYDFVNDFFTGAEVNVAGMYFESTGRHWIHRSTFTGMNWGGLSFYDGGSVYTDGVYISSSYFHADGNGVGVEMSIQGRFDISGSTFVSRAGEAADLGADIGFSVTDSFFRSGGGWAVSFYNSFANGGSIPVLRSTITTTSKNGGAINTWSSSIDRSFTECYIECSGGADAECHWTNATRSAIVRSTIVSNNLRAAALVDIDARVTDSLIVHLSTRGYALENRYSNADDVRITGSTLTSRGQAALRVASNATGFISGSYLDGARYGAWLTGASSFTIVDSTVRGSTAVYVHNATGVVIGGSVLVATAPAGVALHVSTGSTHNLSLSSSVLRAGELGMGVQVDRNGRGLLALSSNTISGGRVGVFIGTRPYAESVVHLASNTVVVSTSGAFDTHGVLFDGLRNGATVENNSLVVRAAGSMAGFTLRALELRSAKGIVVSRNRLSNPGHVTAGSVEMLRLDDADDSEFGLADVYSTGTALTDAYLIRAVNGSTGLRMSANILFSSFAVSGASAVIAMDAASPLSSSDYNDYFSSNSLLSFEYAGAAVQGLAGWQAATGLDSQSLSAHPQWYAPEREDFHPRSAGGRWNPATQAFVNDGSSSLTIDAADPSEDFSNETSPNGGRMNQGSYGNTAEASRTPPGYPGCAVTRNVGAGQDFATVQAGVNALPVTLTGHSCVVIRDNATYAEQVTVRNFVNNGSSITIFTDPGVGSRAVIDPPSASTAAFLIHNASVNVYGIDIRPNDEAVDAMYGIWASSAHVRISSVNIDAGGTPANKVAVAGVRLSSWSALSYSSVTVGSAHGVWLDGSTMSAVSYSSAVNGSVSLSAVYLEGARNNSLTVVFASATSRYGLMGWASDTNTVTMSRFWGGDIGVYWVGAYNTISQSTMAALTDYALYLAVSGGVPSGSNTVTGSYMEHAGGIAAYVASNNNVLAQSTMTSASTSNTLGLDGSGNVVTGCMITNTAGWAAYVGGDYQTVSFSTMSTRAGGYSALFINGGIPQWNRVTDSYIANALGDAAVISFSNLNTIARSTMVSSAYAYALNLNQADSNLIEDSLILSTAGIGIRLANGSDLNTVARSTVIAAASLLEAAVYVTASATNTFVGSYIQGSTATLVSGATGTVVSASVLVATNTAGSVLRARNGIVNLSVASTTLLGAAAGEGLALEPGARGVVSLSSVVVTQAARGVVLSTPSAGFTLAVDSVTFRSLASGATAIHFLGGTFVSTITAAGFEDASVGANVSGAALDLASRVTMRGFSGARSGPAFENDPNSLVDWEEPAYPGCVVTRNVGAGRLYATVSAGVAALPSTLGGHSCVVIRDAATYAEQVTVEGFTNNGSSISIFTDPAVGLRALVDPPSASTAAFVIRNASVNVLNIDVRPTDKAVDAVYGVYASSAYVRISSVNVDAGGTPAGKIGVAGVRVSSWSIVSHSSITVGSAHGVWLEGSSMTWVLNSTAVAAGAPPRRALYVNGGSSNTVADSYFSNASASAVGLDGGASHNTILRSTISSADLGVYALEMVDGSSNSIVGSYVQGAGNAVYASGGGWHVLSGSTFTSRWLAVEIDFMSGVQVVGSRFHAPDDTALMFVNADRFSVSASTITNANAAYALRLDSASSGTVTGSYVYNAAGGAASLSATSNFNAFNLSTFSATGAGSIGFLATNSSYNVVTQSYLTSPAGFALQLVSASRYNTVSRSTMVVNNGGNSSLLFNSASSNTVDASLVLNLAGGTAGNISSGSNFTTIRGSTFTSAGATALWVPGSSYNSISGSVFTTSGGSAVWLDGVNTGNSIAYSTIASGGNSRALRISQGSSNTVTGSYIQASTPVYVTNSTGTAIHSSVLVSTYSGASGDVVFLGGGSVNLSIASSTLLGDDGGRGVALSSGNSGTLSLSSVVVSGASFGVTLATPTAGFVLDVDSINLRGLAPGATGIHFLGGTFVATVTAAAFEDASVGANVVGAPLDTASRITMRGYGGPRAGTQYENDPNGLVDWIGEAIDYPGCVFTANVGGGQQYATISAGVAALPASLTGHSCVVIRDAATYAEQVTVEGFTNNGSSISIFTDPAVGARAVLDPPSGATAGFAIKNASVNVAGIDVVPTVEAVGYGVQATSDNVKISSVNVDSGGNVSTAGLRLQSFSTVEYSSVSVQNATALLLSGSTASLVTRSSFSRTSGANAVVIQSDSDFNVLSDLFIRDPANDAMVIQSGCDSNSILRSTVVAGGAGGIAIFVNGASSFTVSGSYLYAALNNAFLDTSASAGTVIERSTMSSGGSNPVVRILGDGALVADSLLVQAGTGAGLRLEPSADRSFVLRSTITAGDDFGLDVRGSSAVIHAVYVQASTAARVNAATGTVIESSVLVSTGSAASALMVENGSVGLTVASTTLMGSAQGRGLLLDRDNTSVVAVGSVAIMGVAHGVQLATQAAGFELAVDSITFRGLAAGATAVHFLGGVHVATITLAGFEDASIAANVSGAALDLASRVTMRAFSGPRGGPVYENDPNGLVDWGEPPSGVTLWFVSLSSAGLSWTTTPGAEGYAVEASTRNDFQPGTVVSSTVFGTQDRLSVLPLFPNTTYYLRAGALWSGSTIYAPTVVSTPTLADLASGTTVYSIHLTSMAVNWVPLPSSPPDASSKTAEGYVLQASSMATFSPLWNSSFTANVALSTLSIDTLRGGVTYYFRVGTLNHAGAANWAPAVSTLMPVQLGVELTTHTISVPGLVNMNDTVLITTSVVVTNTGNVKETYWVRATTLTVGSPWRIGATQALDQYVLSMLINGAEPVLGDFGAEDKLADAEQACTGLVFAFGGDCVQVPVGATRTLWFKLDTPTVTSTAASQDIRIFVRAVRDPDPDPNP